MSLLTAHQDSELGHQAIVHGFEAERTAISQAVQSLLAESRQYIVQAGDEVHHIEQALGAYIGQNIFNTKNLIGQVIQFDGTHIMLQSGTSFPARAANDERFALAA
jgi:hypothetical protein